MPPLDERQWHPPTTVPPAIRAHNRLLVRSAVESEVLPTAMVLTTKHHGRAAWESATRVTARTKRILLRFILWSNGPRNQMDPVVDDNKLASSCGCAPRIIIIIILGKLRLRGAALGSVRSPYPNSKQAGLLDQSGATRSTLDRPTRATRCDQTTNRELLFAVETIGCGFTVIFTFG